MADQLDKSEPDASFESARLKVEWANKQINALNAGVKQFIEMHNNAPITEDGKGFLNLKPVPADFSLLAGDAIFSLRSALDCCWMGLRRAMGKEGKKTLPRAKTRKELIETMKKASVEEAFKGSDALIMDEINACQDGNEILWFGGQVDNWNKHNMIILTTQGTEVRDAVVKSDAGFTMVMRDNYIEGHIEGGSIKFDSPVSLSPDHKANIAADVFIVSKDPVDKRPLILFVTSLLKETHKAVELFVATCGQQATKVGD